MDLKHSPEEAFEQTPWQNCFQKWGESPLGQRIRQLLVAEIRRSIALRYSDRLLQIAPVDLLSASALQPAWVLRLLLQSMAKPALARPEMPADIVADPGFLPLAPESFAGILLIQFGTSREERSQVIAEAVRVLAPEGYLFLLETNVCRSPLGSPWALARASLPAGLRRRENRKQLQAAGLQVRRQLALTVLPGALPLRWQQVLANADARMAVWFPAAASCVLTVAQRRQPLPMAGGRWRWTRQPAGAAGSSQWAWRRP